MRFLPFLGGPAARTCLASFLAAGLTALAGCGGGGGQATPLGLDSVYPVRGSAAGGQQVQLKGQGFSAGVRVTIDGQDCSSLVVTNDSSLTCVTPAHATGSVDVAAIATDGSTASLPGAYAYRPSGSGIESFGIVGTGPAPGVRAAPFAATLQSLVSGFDPATTTRAWVVDGVAHQEGDSVTFGAGNHTVSLQVQDVTGDSEQATWSVVVGQPSAQAGQGIAGSSFTLAPGDAIAMVNTGLFPVLNPRFIGAGKPDYVDWSRYLNSVNRLAGLPTDASEASRGALLVAAWQDLSNTTVHVCSPGREDENIIDPTLLIRGYGYECCSEASRALAFLGSFLDVPSRVRSTVSHEFPEFTVGGNLFILDPDARYRYWGDNQLPLSAWTSSTTPVSLMNVQHYYAETPLGQTYETQAGGTLPFGSVSAFPEATLRSFYTQDIVAETIFGYHEAFTNPDYLLYPGEKMAFSQTSGYQPLQWLNADGTPTGGALAPAVGEVMFRQVWSASGPRTFQQDAAGHRVIPLNGLPFPVQDLVFHFRQAVDPQAAWLTAGGQSVPIGSFSGSTWTVSAAQLRAFTSLSDLAAVVPSGQDLVSVDIGMQFNAGIFGSPAVPVSLTYADDSGDCQRRVGVANGSGEQDFVIGGSLCDAQAPQRAEARYDLTSGQPGTSVISYYGNSYQGSWGLAASAGILSYAEITLPRTPGLPGLLRASDGGNFSDWQIDDGTGWTSLPVVDVATSQWITLPATASSTSHLRLVLRQVPSVDVTYLAYLSLIEGQDTASPYFVPASSAVASASQAPRAATAAAKTKAGVGVASTPPKAKASR